jgi:hypothetical protein
MNWPVVAIFAYLLLGLELALKPALALEPSGIAPSFVLPLVAFIALHAPAMAALWVALCIGVVLDLTDPTLAADGRYEITVLGPMAIGCLAAAYTSLTIRGLLVRRNPITLIVLAVMVALIANLVAVAMLSMRSIYDAALVVHPTDELVRGVFSAGYTAGSAAVLAAIFTPLAGLFGFHQESHGRRMARRGH